MPSKSCCSVTASLVFHFVNFINQQKSLFLNKMQKLGIFFRSNSLIVDAGPRACLKFGFKASIVHITNDLITFTVHAQTQFVSS